MKDLANLPMDRMTAVKGTPWSIIADKGDTGLHKTNRPREVVEQSDSRDKGTQQMKGGDENE